jgi:hypothetical protein
MIGGGDWKAAVSDLREWTRGRIDTAIVRLFGWTRVAKSSPMGDTDQVETDDDAKGQRPARRLEPWGLRSRPVKGSRSLWLRLGSSNVIFLGIAPATKYGPQSLNEGETALYNVVTGCTLLFDQNGNIIAAVPGGQTIQLGGTTPAARKGDGVGNGVLAMSAPPGTSITSIAIQYTPGDGSAVQSGTLNPGGAVILTIKEKITGGSSVVQLG